MPKRIRYNRNDAKSITETASHPSMNFVSSNRIESIRIFKISNEFEKETVSKEQRYVIKRVALDANVTNGLTKHWLIKKGLHQ